VRLRQGGYWRRSMGAPLSPFLMIAVWWGWLRHGRLPKIPEGDPSRRWSLKAWFGLVEEAARRRDSSRSPSHWTFRTIGGWRLGNGVWMTRRRAISTTAFWWRFRRSAWPDGRGVAVDFYGGAQGRLLMLRIACLCVLEGSRSGCKTNGWRF